MFEILPIIIITYILLFNGLLSNPLVIPCRIDKVLLYSTLEGQILSGIVKKLGVVYSLITIL